MGSPVGPHQVVAEPQTCQAGGRLGKREAEQHQERRGRRNFRLMATAEALCGARVTSVHVSAGTSRIIIAGVIRFCASRRSLHAIQ